MEIHHLVWMPRESNKKQKKTLSFPLFYFLSLNVLAHVILASKNRRVSLIDFFKSLECSLGDKNHEFQDSDFIHSILRFRVLVSIHR